MRKFECSVRALVGLVFALACGACSDTKPEVVARVQARDVAAPVVGPEFEVGRLFLPNPADEMRPAIAGGAETLLVTWASHDSLTGDWLVGTRVSSNGAVLDASPIYLATTGAYARAAIAHDGTNWLVAWSDGAKVKAVRVSGDGFVLDANDLVLTSTSGAIVPAVAFDGTNFFVAWTDSRNGGNYHIYGARIAPNGTLLDPTGIPLSGTSGQQSAPAISAGGSGFFVAWADTRNGNYDIYGARIGHDGSVLDATGIPICTDAAEQNTPAVSFGGTSALVTWSDRRNVTYDVYGARVEDGTLLDPSGIAVATGGPVHGSPSSTFDGTDWLVTFGESSGVVAKRISVAGSVLDASGIAVTSSNVQGPPAVGHAGASSLVVWPAVGSSSTDRDILGKRVDAGGSMLDSNAIRVSTRANDQFFPAAAYNGTDWLAVWAGQQGGATGDLYAARVGGTGTVHDPNGFPVSTAPGNQAFPVVSWGGANWLVVWATQTAPGQGYDISGARVGADATVLEPNGSLLVHASPQTPFPQVAHLGTTALVVWTEQVGSDNDIYGLRVTGDLSVLDTSPIHIGEAAFGGIEPQVASDGANWLVVWSGKDGATSVIRGTRVAPDGTLLDAASITMPSSSSQNVNSPAVAHDGVNWLVAWRESTGGGDACRAARVDASGAVLDATAIVIGGGLPNPNVFSAPRIAHDGTNFFVVFSANSSLNFVTVFGARISPSGTLLDPDPFSIAGSFRRGAANPSLASGPPGSVLVPYLLGSTDHSQVKLRIVSQPGTGGGAGAGGGGSPGLGGVGGNGGAGQPGSGGVGATGGDEFGSAGVGGESSEVGGQAGVSNAAGMSGENGSGNAGVPGDAGQPGNGGSSAGGSQGGGAFGGNPASGNAGSGASSGNAGSGNAGSGNAGSGNAGSGNAGNTSHGGGAGAPAHGTDSTSDDGGCGCRVASTAPNGARWAFATLFVGLGTWRRRRVRPQRGERGAP